MELIVSLSIFVIVMALVMSEVVNRTIAAMGLKDYTLAGGSVIPVINGKDGAAITTANFTDKTNGIAGLLGKGTLVKVYTSDTVANQITDIVVIQSQVMASLVLVS